MPKFAPKPQVLLCAFALLLLLPVLAGATSLSFTEVSGPAGVVYQHGFGTGLTTEVRTANSGVAVGDFDGDDWLDLYVVTGDIGTNKLFRNLGDGTFTDVAAAAGVDVAGERSSGPSFFDYDGDGWLDLFVGGIDGSPLHLFRNRGDGTFEETTGSSGITVAGNTVSSAFGDYDRDGDLDLVLSHWNTLNSTEDGRIWRNRGDGTFEKVTDVEAGISGYEVFDYSLSPNFVDYDDDGWPDLVSANDFGTSKVFRNRGDGTFEDLTTDVITDENGMGSAFGDYDGDGDLDWFVSSIWDPDQFNGGANWGLSGNRFYENLGDGTFADVTDATGTREGYWGWGACFEDFDNDTVLDLFHVNGFWGPNAGEYWADPSRLFMGNGDGTFSEQSVALGVDDDTNGRGIVCFDYDRDGDVDILIVNNTQPPKLYRNEGGNRGRFLNVRLRWRVPNLQAIGARIRLVAGGQEQIRELNAECNYVSHQPAEVHFGLGGLPVVDEIEVIWPDGTSDRWFDVPADQFLELAPRAVPEVPTLGQWGLAALVLLLLAGGAAALRRRPLARR